ncbi:sensor histidine kinase [Aquincola tertiaricarbonis]|uniref:sensor histidine kinase n=1 Tax=Aquincola tertiaricarbonis TaxID=391953 RepID=UPI000614A005|nr:ATP-binding protein [Aquincola tertiaricarbonis]
MHDLRILHLEDDPFDADLVHREVTRLGRHPMWCQVGNAEEFHAAIDQHRFDAVVSDNSVPGITGLQAMELARQRQPGIPFIFVSGRTDPYWSEHCLAAGATDYVPKNELWRLPSALQRLNAARETQRLATLTEARALLVDLVKQLSMARSVEAVVQVVRRGARQLTGADGATFVLREGELCHYVDEDAIGPLWKGRRFGMDSCISGWVMRQGRAAVVPDVRLDERIPQDAYAPTFVRSLVMVPIRAEAPIGAIGNYWSVEHAATDDQVALLQALADSTSLALENVALLQGLEQRVQQRTGELREANRELEAFSYSLSHDLRAPLRAVQGYADLLLMDHEPPLHGQTEQFVRHIALAARRMDTLIDDMLTLAKVQRSDLRLQPVRIGALVREMLATLQQREPQRQVRLEIDDTLVAQADLPLLRLALDNLVANAWKFSSRQPDAVIGFSAAPAANGGTEFCLWDNGAGFDMAQAGQLFEPFRRLHKASDFPGTGIGLAIVHRVVQRHGGRIHAQAAPGQGARFHFTLAPQLVSPA